METYKQLLHPTYLFNYHVVFCPKLKVDEAIIRQYLQKQEVKERQVEQMGFDW